MSARENEQRILKAQLECIRESVDKVLLTQRVLLVGIQSFEETEATKQSKLCAKIEVGAPAGKHALPMSVAVPVTFNDLELATMSVDDQVSHIADAVTRQFLRVTAGMPFFDTTTNRNYFKDGQRTRITRIVYCRGEGACEACGQPMRSTHEVIRRCAEVDTETGEVVSWFRHNEHLETEVE